MCARARAASSVRRLAICVCIALLSVATSCSAEQTTAENEQSNFFFEDDYALDDDYFEDLEDTELDLLRRFAFNRRRNGIEIVDAVASTAVPEQPLTTVDDDYEDIDKTTSTTTPTQPLVHNYSSEFLASANDYNISNRVLDIFYFTQYCGPSDRVWKRPAAKINTTLMAGTGRQQQPHSADEPNVRFTYSELDLCCKQHDECPHYITRPEQYGMYPGLEYRSQYFSRLQCKCDGMFYQCLNNMNSRYANAIAIGYGIVQSYCFDLDYPIVRCSRRSLRRCEEYVVDATQPKRWQWFDVPPAYKKIYAIPQTINTNQEAH